ncbi:Imm21 family immunity protein [Actinomadura kijaniata]|uniref:Imm21 family immunity protein n=1 Tax=Actinomadura kijaniata TaxID=46161 RepID=UPI0008295009|nr:Imm21 family immunity protein [Actinomadura kijaniata]
MPRRSLSCRWVTSAGGPLIAVPESKLTHWGGVTDDDGPVETWGDYGRACAVEGYIGLVEVDGQHALVFGEEPAPTTYLPDKHLFARIAAADSEADFLAAVVQVVAEHMPWDHDETLTWEVHEPVVLFDSAWPGAETEPDNHLRIDTITPGRYQVRATYRQEPDNWMILVHLQPIPAADIASNAHRPGGKPAQPT